MNNIPYIHIPHYPDYAQVRLFLQLSEGVSRKLMWAMRYTLEDLRGTPQATQDWSEPDVWIPNLLKGEQAELAFHLWNGSNHTVYPNALRGIWLLCVNEGYGLLQSDTQDILRVTEAGKDFIANLLGETEKRLDFSEGLSYLLGLVAEKGPGKRSDFLGKFETFITQYSDIKSTNVVKSYWHSRIQNLVARGLVERSGVTYQISGAGLAYLETVPTIEVPIEVASSPNAPEPLRDIRRLLREQEDAVREQIRETLRTINPYLFEELVKRLLEAMGYEDVEVTSASHDGGVDVKAKIEVGITTVTEVVQVKRYQGSISRPVLDQLRGSLHRFDAMRGTIISTGKFSSGTKEAAFEKGAAPITLIDGDKLIDLLMEHEIGVRKEQIRLIKFEASDFIITPEQDGGAG